MDLITLFLMGAMAGGAGGFIVYILAEWRVKRKGRETDTRMAARNVGKEIMKEEWTEIEQDQINVGVKNRMDTFYNGSVKSHLKDK